MRMKPEHARRLVELSNRGNNSLLTSLIIARRFARHVRNEDSHDYEQYRTELAAAQAGLPFTASKVAELKKSREAKQESRNQSLLKIAGWLRMADSLLVKFYGFERICDLLCVNPVHRAEAKALVTEASGTITAIAFIAGLEDSASTASGRRKPDWNDGPLFHAFHRQMMQIMLDNPDAMPDPFAPDGPFYGVPTYTQQPDGTMVMNTPTVTVHGASGSKVVRGKPRRAGKPVTPGKVATLFTDNENVSRHVEVHS